MSKTIKSILDDPHFSQLEFTQHILGKSKMTKGDHSIIVITKSYTYDESSEKDNPGWLPLNEPITVYFDFHDNIYNESSEIDWLLALQIDKSIISEANDFADFIDESGYEILNGAMYREARECYEGCKKAKAIWNELFNEKESEMLDEWLNENM